MTENIPCQRLRGSPPTTPVRLDPEKHLAVGSQSTRAVPPTVPPNPGSMG